MKGKNFVITKIKNCYFIISRNMYLYIKIT